MLFFDFFQNLVDSNAQVTVEMKNDVQITGSILRWKTAVTEELLVRHVASSGSVFQC